MWLTTNHHIGWPRKNATPLITNFKEIRDKIKLVSVLMSKTLFFQQNGTKIKDFLFKSNFSEAMSLSKFAPFVSKFTFEVGRNFFE